MCLCIDSNVRYGDSDFTGYCYNDNQCQDLEGYYTFYYGLNSCCGNGLFSGYYSLSYSGDCLLCKDCMIVNSMYAAK